MKRLATLVALVLGSAACAAQSERPFKFIGGLGVTGGGSTLATVNYTNGTSQNISAGSGVMLYVGGEAPLGTLVNLQATFGYHFDTTHATNGDVTFSRYPIDVIAQVPVTDRFRLGVGVEFINNPKLSGSGIANVTTTQFDSAVGVLVEGEYRFTSWIGVKLRGLSAKFKATNTGQTISGDHVGLFCNFYF
jgi:hypothetical protein